ncbi:MAG: class I SAM-dependent methyltransferase [Spirochaetaceae bacterium]|nr:class I SAM-dependent methyltransferase [Spirochaetaceae bacterium]
MNESRRNLENLAHRLEAEGWSVIPPERYLSDMDRDFLKIWDRVKPFTMISPERGWALAEAVRYICRSGIPGDIVECGVWKGGACLLASHILAAEETDTNRRIWLFDTFSGMVPPGSDDRIASSRQSLSERDPEGWWASSIAEVKKTLSRSHLNKESFQFVSGPVEETLDREVPEIIAVLRLDTDWYESTMKELEVLFPRLSPGGVLIIDDYGHFTGAKKAVDEYFRRQGETILLHRSDYTGRVLIKK